MTLLNDPSMHVGADALGYESAERRDTFKREAGRILRILGFWPAHIVLVALAIYAYHRTAISWESETVKYSFGDVPPIYANYTPREFRMTPPFMVPLAIVGTWAALIWAQLRWKVLPLWIFPIVALAFVFSINITTAMIDGRSMVFEPFSRTMLEYIADVPQVGNDPVKFLQKYPSINAQLTIHAGTHPPGGVLFLYYVAKWFDPSVKTASYAAIAFSSLGVVFAFLLGLRLHGAKGAVIAAGMYAVMPGLVLFGATSMDSVFVVMPVVGVWLIHEALSRKHVAWAILIAVLAGAALTASMFMTFATLCVGIFYIFYALFTPRKQFPRTLIVLSVALATFILCHFVLYWTLGYDVIACSFASVERDARTMGSGFETTSRYLDLSTANFMAFLVAAGVPAVALWFRSALKNRFALTFLVAMIIISFSTLFTLETERIWIFLLPILACVCAGWLAKRWPITAAIFIALTFLQTWLMEALLYTHW